MALGDESHLSMRRIVLVAVLAIILPSLVLTLVGLKLTLDLKRQLEQSLADQYASAARAKVEEIEVRVAVLEDRVKRTADRLEPDEIPSTLDALPRHSPIVEQLFLLDERLRMLYPQEPEAAPTLPETLLWSEPFPPAARQVLSGSPEGRAKALGALQRYRERTLSPAARARSTQAIAALYFRTGRFAEAVAEYRRLLQVDDAAAFSPSLALLARYQIAAAQIHLGQAQDALATLLDVYADLVREQTGVADATRIAYFKQRAAGDIEALLGRPDIPRPEGRRFAALVEEEKSRAARARFLAYLRGFIELRLKLQAPALRPEEEGFRHHWDDEFADQPYLIAYAAVRGPDDSRRIVGFKVDLDYVRREILADALGSSRFGPRVAFVVRDRRQHAVFGEAGSGEFAAWRPFPTVFRGWRLGVVERQPAELRDLAYRNVTLFAVVTSAMILAIILGVILTLKGTARELELSRLKSDFVSNVSHELKTPLALIRMFAETLEMGRVKEEAKVREYYSIITRESERLTQLINNVLDFSRIEGGRKTYDLRLDDLADVVHDTLHAYSYELAKQRFTVETDVPDDLPETLMDRNAISLALLNLLSNAVKYSRDDRRIRVACAARNGALHVAVTDHGIGIDKADLPRVFDKFFRVRDEAVLATRGSGLGLAIVKHSIEAHGGTITVESQKDQGSTFTITLPIRKTLTDGERTGMRNP